MAHQENSQIISRLLVYKPWSLGRDLVPIELVIGDRPRPRFAAEKHSFGQLPSELRKPSVNSHLIALEHLFCSITFGDEMKIESSS